MKRPELLAPVGNLEKLEVALTYGADAVYLGSSWCGLRTGAGLTEEEIEEAIKLAHQRNRKVYLAVNIFAYNQDFISLPSYLKKMEKASVDGLIVADPGVFRIAKRNTGLPIHISTQANVTNLEGARFWKDLGARRITLARELSFDQIKDIAQSVDIGVEIFIHGAMCISYSGRCLLSKYLAGREANRGDCAHSCRWRYYLVEEKRPGFYHPVEEDGRGTYFFNSKDLCLVEHIPKLIEAGIESFKIEGRMKSLAFLATTVKVYREVIDSYCRDPGQYRFRPEWRRELEKVSHRGYTTGFTFDDGEEKENIRSGGYQRFYDFVAVVKDCDRKSGQIELEVRNRLEAGEQVEVLCPQGENMMITVPLMEEASSGERLTVAHANYEVKILMDKFLPQGSLLRRKVAD